jgi:rsbT co-antagonist protein RsbR
MTTESRLSTILRKYEHELAAEWIKEQVASGATRSSVIREADLKAQCDEFMRLLADAAKKGNLSDVSSADLTPVREMLARVSASRGEQGFTPSETATFVFAFKRPLFARIRRELEGDAAALFQEIWIATELLDKLGLYTTEVHQKSREKVIARQRDEMLELSTPVVKLWDGILALPLIGTLDSQRTQTVMETLLTRIVETGSEVAIIDITGVPTVDTLVAQHLMKTVSAARLMGVDCILSGIRPQIAQTIVHLGVDLGDVVTKASLAEAFRVALKKSGRALPQGTPAAPAKSPAAPGRE